MKIRKLITQKKGDVFQVLFMIVLIFAVAVVGLLMFVLTSRVNEFWEESGLLNETEAGTAAIETMSETAPRTTDYAIFFLFLGMNIGVLIAAVRTNFSAAVIFLFILLTLIAIMMSAGMVNMYQGLAQQPSIIDVSSKLTLTNFIFSRYLPLVISMICAVVMLIMYGKSGGDIIA